MADMMEFPDSLKELVGNMSHKSKLCETCAHTKVCCKDKNLFGDVFVPGNPMFFDNKVLWGIYEERKAAGFPCDDYLSERKKGEWIIDHLCSTSGGTYQVLRCSVCEHQEPWQMQRNFCPNCGAEMKGE